MIGTALVVQSILVIIPRMRLSLESQVTDMYHNIYHCMKLKQGLQGYRVTGSQAQGSQSHSHTHS